MSLKRNLDQLVFDQLKDRIINGDWEQGRNLEVDELANYYEVSRTPVLQALKRMQNEGMLVVSRVGKYYLPTYDAKQVGDICRTRLILELEALDEIRAGGNAVDWTPIEKLARWCERRTTCGDVTASRRYDMEWHKSLVEGSGNECLINIYTKVQGQFMIANYLQVFHSKQQQLAASDDHLILMRHLEDSNFEEAKAALTRHIEDARDRIIARIPNSTEVGASVSVRNV